MSKPITDSEASFFFVFLVAGIGTGICQMHGLSVFCGIMCLALVIDHTLEAIHEAIEKIKEADHD